MHNGNGDTDAEDEAAHATPEGKPAADYEEEAFKALGRDERKKQAQAACKPKAKAKGKPKAKAKGMGKGKGKKDIVKKSISFKKDDASSKVLAYSPPAPTSIELKSKRECYVDKHYHKAKNMALASG